MKTKYKEPTQDQIVDFYYLMFIFLDKSGHLLSGHDLAFCKYPHRYSSIINRNLEKYPRETSPEVYEYDVIDGDINIIVRDQFMIKKSIYLNRKGKRKIKITICKD